MKNHAYGNGHLDVRHAYTPRGSRVVKGPVSRSTMVQQWRQLAEAAVDPTCLYSSTASTALMKAIGKLAAHQCTKNVAGEFTVWTVFIQ